MAKFELELPDSIIDDLDHIYLNCDEIFGKMTRAGAEVAMKNIKRNVPKSFLGSNIMHCLYMTRTYKTPSDDGINTQVGFYGYFINKKGKKVTEKEDALCEKIRLKRQCCKNNGKRVGDC